MDYTAVMISTVGFIRRAKQQHPLQTLYALQLVAVLYISQQSFPELEKPSIGTHNSPGTNKVRTNEKIIWNYVLYYNIAKLSPSPNPAGG